MSFVEEGSGLPAKQFPGGLTPLNLETDKPKPQEAKPSGSFRFPVPIFGFSLPTPETVGAAFRLENDVYAGTEFATRPEFAPEEGHNPLDVIEGSRFETDYLDNFLGSMSEAETRSIMSRIEREEKDRETLAAAGIPGLMAGIAAGALSPTTLVPVGGWLARGVQTGRLARSAVSAAEVGAVTGAAIAAQETVLQTTQETRTAAETFWNIAGGTVIGGALGAAVGATVGRSGIDALTEKAATGLPATLADETRMWTQATAVGAAVTSSTRGSGELKGALGAEQAFSFQDPLIRSQTSPFEAARNTVRDLAETPLTLAENAEGIPTTIGGSVETQIKMAEAPLDQAMTVLDRAFSEYYFGKKVRFSTTRSALSSLTGRSGGKMNYSQFKEAVYDAMLAGDVHPVPEVQKVASAWRNKVWEPPKNDAIALRIFTEDVKPLDDAGYVPRVYNTAAIAARRPEFVEILTRHFEARQKDIIERVEELERTTGAPDVEEEIALLTRDEIRDIAEKTADTILGHSPQRLLTPADLVAGPRGPLKERVLRIPTTLIRDFVERDPEVLGRMYTRTMAADIGLVKKFGSTDLSEQIAKINDEANQKITAAKSEKERTKLDKQRTAAVRDIQAIRDRLRGTYALPNNPDGLLVRTGRVLRNLNYVRLLGGMQVSAIPDIGKVLFSSDKGGFAAFRTAWHPLVRGLTTFKLAAKEAKLAGTALDMTLDSRVMAIADVMDDYGRGSKFERGLTGLTRKFGVVSLMAPWNAAIKQFVGIVAQTRMLEAIERIAKGKGGTKEVEYLAAGGIDSGLADRIAAQFEKAGVKDGAVWWANTEAWTDRQAIESFRAFMVREIDRTIVTPGQDKPLWMSSEFGKMIGQFRSFNVASIQRTMIAGLQQRDMAALNGAVLMLGLGALTYKIKADFFGYEVSDDPKKWAVEAFDRSGLAGWLADANNIAEKATRGRVGLSAFTGETASRYASRNTLGALLGPSFDLVGDGITLTGAASMGEWTASDTHSLRKIMPLQNVYYLRYLFDRVEKAGNEAFGVPARKN